MVGHIEFLNAELLAAEKSRIRVAHHGRIRMGIGYPNSYHVAMSSLAYQWIVEKTAEYPDIGVERFFAESELEGFSLETRTPLSHFDGLAFSCSFELDAANLLRCLRSAAIPLLSVERRDEFPLVVLGGSLASINPLPLAPAIDVFCLGAAERMWSIILDKMLSRMAKAQILEELADLDGFFVPVHHLDGAGQPRRRVRRLEKKSIEFAKPSEIPASHIVTANTEYKNRGLIEISRGCPEKCRYCWVSHNYGRLGCYPKDGILSRVEELSRLNRRIGLVATAVGDHPQLVEILDTCRKLNAEVALSSLRISAMTREILEPLAASGANSVTIAPETGTDELRKRLNKDVSNAQIIRAVETAQAAGISSLKMYFIIGLPGETDADLDGMVDLIRTCHAIIRSAGRQRGRLGTLHIGLNLLIPKPYTPYSKTAMLSPNEAKRRLKLVANKVSRLPNLEFDRPSYRQSVWQGFLSRADTRAFTLLEQTAAGVQLGRLLSENRALVEEVTLGDITGRPTWQFISSAPIRR